MFGFAVLLQPAHILHTRAESAYDRTLVSLYVFLRLPDIAIGTVTRDWSNPGGDQVTQLRTDGFHYGNSIGPVPVALKLYLLRRLPIEVNPCTKLRTSICPSGDLDHGASYTLRTVCFEGWFWWPDQLDGGWRSGGNHSRHRILSLGVESASRCWCRTGLPNLSRETRQFATDPIVFSIFPPHGMTTTSNSWK